MEFNWLQVKHVPAKISFVPKLLTFTINNFEYVRNRELMKKEEVAAAIGNGIVV